MTNKRLAFQQLLHARFDKIANWHHEMIGKRLPDRLPTTRALILAVLVVGFIAALMNYQVRDRQYDVWKANQQAYFLDETPLFSTTDASFFLGLARQYNETGDFRDYESRRLYPFLKQQNETAPAMTSMRDFPLLSVIIATLAPDNSSTSLLKTGNALIPVFAFIMAIAVMLAFGAAGFWFEGAVAAVGAGLSYSFMARTSIGRIDTDILNLGFFYGVLALTIFAARAPGWRNSVLWAIAAGLLLNLFFWWYEKAFMGWAFAIGLMWLSYFSSRDWRRPVVLVALFLLVSGLAFKGITALDDSAYLADVMVEGALIYPNTFNTITELRVVPFVQILTDIGGYFWIGVLGVVGLVLFVIRYPVLSVIYGPASVFALANFLVGNRAVFYSAPMLWFGVAFLVVMLWQSLSRYLPAKLTSYPHSREVMAAGLSLVMIGATMQWMPTSQYVPRPSFPKEVIKGFRAMDGNLPADAVIATWWDYGYASMLFNKYNTLHDGGIQTSPATHYVARALIAPSQQETAAILKYLASDGLNGIAQNAASFEAVEQAFVKGPVSPTPPVYLVLTEQMGGWIGSVSKLGLWDTKNGQPILLSGAAARDRLGYLELRCQASETASIECNGNPIDFNQGTVSGQPLLQTITQAKNGFATARQNYHEKAISHLHLADVEGRGTRVMSFHERLAGSTFHELFHLGQIENNLFTLVYDDYPHMRIFEVR